MYNFVLDCSVVMSWCFEDEMDDYSLNILQKTKISKVSVPPLWFLEVTNALLLGEKRNRLTIAESTKFLELLDSLPIYVSDLWFSPPEIMNVARNYQLTSYDSIYLLLAMHKGYSMATKDKALIKACIETGVPIFN